MKELKNLVAELLNNESELFINTLMYGIIANNTRKRLEMDEIIPWSLTDDLDDDIDGVCRKHADLSLEIEINENINNLCEHLLNNNYDSFIHSASILVHELRHAWQWLYNIDLHLWRNQTDLPPEIAYIFDPAETDASKYQQEWKDNYIDDDIEKIINKLRKRIMKYSK
jgi:hypothetical protein